MRNRIIGILFSLIMAGMPLYIFFSGSIYPSGAQRMWRNGFRAYAIEILTKYAMPGKEQLRQLGLELRLFGGQREQNGIFISEDGLMRNLDAPVDAFVYNNSKAISEFAKAMYNHAGRKKHVYLAVIPTSGGVLTQQLPQFASSQMMNQQRMLEDLYTQVSSHLRTVDVYSALQEKRNKYIYYRTENNLTALGGYYVYVAMARRMGMTALPRGSFNIEYVDHAYYGDLYTAPFGEEGEYATAPYGNIKPDTLSLFHYSASGREYLMTLRTGDDFKTYHTLFPMQFMHWGKQTDVFLGNSSAITEITTSSTRRTKLLVFSDNTAKAYLPFLVNHYNKVAFINLGQMTQTDIEKLDIEEYDEILLAYSIESYLHTQEPAKLAGMLTDA